MSRPHLDVRVDFDVVPLLRVLTRSAIAVELIGTTCHTCRAYLAQRDRAIAHHLVVSPPPDSVGQALRRLMAGVHHRHQLGHAILSAAGS